MNNVGNTNMYHHLKKMDDFVILNLSQSSLEKPMQIQKIVNNKLPRDLHVQGLLDNNVYEKFS